MYVVEIDELSVVGEVTLIPAVVKLLLSSVTEIVCVVLSGIIESIVVKLSVVSVVCGMVIVDVSMIVVCEVVTVASFVVDEDAVGVVSVVASVEKVIVTLEVVVGESGVGGRISRNIEEKFNL